MAKEKTVIIDDTSGENARLILQKEKHPYGCIFQSVEKVIFSEKVRVKSEE